MNATLLNLQVCHSCPHRQAGHCTRHDRPIHAIAHEGACDLFERSETPCERCGGPHDVERCPIPEGFDVEQERRRTRQGGCCGAPKA